MIELQKYAERRCRNILKLDLEFNPQVQLGRKRMQAYKALIQRKTGNARSSNIIRTALRREIPNPRQLSLEQMQAGAVYCKCRKRLLSDTASQLRKI